MNHYFGKYRGTVVNNIDPLQSGRLQIRCPAVLGESMMAWAAPCVPYAADGLGLYLMPPRDANIWVEFEGGDSSKPIWVGCFWNAGRVPVLPALPSTKVLKVDGITVTLDELPGKGGLTLEVNPPVATVPVKMVFNAQGIELSCGSASIKLDPARVSLNNDALQVM